MEELSAAPRTILCGSLRAFRTIATLAFVLASIVLPRFGFGQSALPLKWINGQITAPSKLAYSPDGTLLAVADGGGIQLITLSSGSMAYFPTSATTAVNTVAFSPDGKTLADGGTNDAGGVVETWNVATGAQVAVYATAANYSVGSLAFSPDGTVLAIGGQSSDATTGVLSGVLELWNPSTVALVASLSTGANYSVASVAFSPDSKTLGVGGYGSANGVYSGVLELWNVPSATLVSSLPTSAGYGVSSVAFSSDGKTLADGGVAYDQATSALSGVLELWNAATATFISALNTSAGAGVNSVAFTADGTKLADGGLQTTSGVSSGVLELWTVSNGGLITTLPTAAVGVNSAVFSPDGSTLAAGGPNTTGGVLETWDVPSASLVKTITTPSSFAITSVAITPDGKTMAVGGYSYMNSVYSGILELWSVATGTRLASLSVGTSFSSIQSVAVSPDGKTLAVGGYLSNTSGYQGILQLWSLSTSSIITTLPTAASNTVNCVAFSPDGKSLVDGGSNSVNGVVELWNVSSQTQTSTFNTTASNGVVSVAFSPDGKTIADGGYGALTGILELWNASTGASAGTFMTTTSGINAVAFSPDGKTLADAGYGAVGGALEFWSVSGEKLLGQAALLPGTQAVSSICFSNDGIVLFAATSSGLQTFITANSERLSNFSIGGVQSLALSSDGTLLANSIVNGALELASTPYLAFDSIGSLAIAPGSVQGGATATATITLSAPAPSGGVTMSLSSNSPGVTVPAKATVAAGATSTTFTVSTSPVSTSTSVTISAASGIDVQTAPLTVTPAKLVSLNLSPTTVNGGNNVTGTLTLSGPAGPGGDVVSVASSNAIASPPATATVPEGQTTGTFQIPTSGVAAKSTSTLTATLNGQSESASLTVVPATLGSVSLSPATVLGGSSTSGTVNLDGAAGPSGVTVTLSSSSSLAGLPKSVTVFAGQNGVGFSITTDAVSVQKMVTISAKSGTESKTAVLTLTPPALVSLNLNPATVSGGATSTGTVTLSAPAATGGITVKLISGSSSATAPSTVTVGAGKTSATFTVKAAAVATLKSVTITASFNGKTETAALTIDPPILSSLAVSPVSVTGGASVTGTVALSGAAPTGGLKVLLSSSIGSVPAPAFVLVAAGKTSATFAIKTLSVAVSTSATLTAKLGGVSEQATLTINPPSVMSLTLNPATVAGGKPSTGTVTISSAAPSGGLVIGLQSGSGSAIVPATVTIAAGKTSATFTVKTASVGSKTTATISAASGSSSKTAVLTIT